MKLSTNRILTTHVGSLPRPPDLLALLEARETGREFDESAFETRLADTVREVVAQQVAAGIDSVCDGEQSKISYTFYVRHRLSGIEAFRGGDNEKPPQTAAHRDLLDHPDFMQRLNQARGGTSWFSREAVPCCTGPVAYRDRRPLEIDLTNLAAACAAVKPAEAFMNAASPGVLTKFVPDRYYRDEDAYVEALANALKEEYEAIVKAGFILQIDAPDLGSARHNQYQHLSCISAGATTKGRTPTTSRSPRSWTSACERARPACRSRRPIRAMRMSGKICAAQKFPTTRSSYRG